MGAQFVDRGKAHHAFRHLRLDRAVGVKRVGHAVDHARLQHRDLRRFLAAGRASRAGLAEGRRCRGRCALAAALRRGFARSGFGQASSKLPAAVRPLRRGGGAPMADWAKVGGQQIRRQRLAGPRGRALALLARARREQQIALRLAAARLRRAAAAGGASAGAASSTQGGGARRLGGEQTVSRRRLIAAVQVAGLNARRSVGSSAGGSAVRRKRQHPSRRATSCSSRAITHRPSMIKPEQAATAPDKIIVLPKLNSLTGMP